MSFRRLNMLNGTITGEPAAGKLLPLRSAVSSGVHQAMLAQDRIIGSGHRVLLQSGLRGIDTFFVQDGKDPDNAGAGYSEIEYPDGQTFRTVARVFDHDLTPGNFITFQALAAPSGPHHGDVSGGGPFFYKGAGGTLRLDVTFKNGDDEEDRFGEIHFDASAEVFQAEASGDADHWKLARLKRMTIRPFLLVTAAQVARWTGARMRVDLTLSYRGSPRVIDVVAYEHPRRISILDTDLGKWVFHGYTNGGAPMGAYPFEYPTEQAVTGGNLALGARHCLRVAGDQGNVLGPAIWQWASGDANDALLSVVDYGSSPTGDDEHLPVSITSTSPSLLWDTGITAWDEDNPGADVGTAAHARQYALNGDHYILEGRQGVVPVWVRAYCKVDAGTGTVRVQTRPWSMVEVDVTSTSYVWVSIPGHLTVGTGPEDDEFIQFFAYATSTDTIDVRAVVVHHRRGLPGEAAETMKSIQECGPRDTTDDSKTKLCVIRTLADGESFTVRARIKALNTGTSPNEHYDRIVERKFYRHTTTTTWNTEQVTPDGGATRSPGVGVGVTADVEESSNEIAVYVTGEAAQTLTWRAYIEIFDD